MGKITDFFDRRVEKFLKRSVGDPHHWITRLAESVQTASGVNVTAETAMQVSTVYSCIKVISETIASLPLKIYRKTEDGREEAPDHPLYPLLHDIGPVPWMTSPEFWEMQIGHNALRGNAYSFIVRDGRNKVIGIVPLNPANMQMDVEINSFQAPKITYKYTPDASGKQFLIPATDIWHLKGISSDGFVGLSPLQLARESIGLSVSAEEHGATFFKNGAAASGIAQYPGTLKEPAAKRFRESIQEAISGSNKFKVLLLEGGATWASMGISNQDSQFLETRQFQVEDIARIFRVPAILIGHPDKSSTYASAEQFMISFTVHTIRPWLVRIEKSISKNLFTRQEQKTYYAEFSVDGLLRGDTKSRYEAYASAIQNTWMSVNEVRRLENLDPRDGGDEYKNPNITVGDDGNTTGEEDI